MSQERTISIIKPDALEGENAIAVHREAMGTTNPAGAATGTIRADFATSIDENAVHGSDGPDTAKAEMAFFFQMMNCAHCYDKKSYGS